MNAATITANFLSREHGRARTTLLVWSAAAVLIASTLSGAGRLGWLANGELWALVPSAVSAGLLGRWLVRAGSLTRAAFARELDARLSLSARLEAAVELSNQSSALASAQHADAVRHFGHRESAGLAVWFAGMAVLVVIFSLLAVEGVVFTARLLRPSASVAAAPKKETTQAAADLHATIDWETPEREIKATAIQEVPLKALAESAKGFRAVSLEVMVNGEHKLSRPLESSALGETTKAGSHELTPSLYLDEVEAQPLDIVSYYLAGELNESAPPRVVSSPLQFVQIRPPRENVAQKGAVDPKMAKMISLLSTLKLAQLRLMESNFGLAHLTDAKSDPAWKTDNARVAAEQRNLDGKAAEARGYALTINAPLLIAMNLFQAGALMTEASQEIAAVKNDQATKPQGRALALITECEKLFERVLEATNPPPPLPMDDPFRDQQVFRLPPRSETPAGALEKLAQRQRELNTQLGSSTDADLKSLAVAEEEIARDAEKLAAQGDLESSVQKFTQDASKEAAAAGGQLGANDRAAAREPSANALSALEKAVAAQDKAGRENAVAELEQVGRELNLAKHTPDADDRLTRLVAARDELRAAAMEQQRKGSSEAAGQLASLAAAIGGTKSAVSSAPPNSAQRAGDLADAAARSQIALAPRDAAIKRVVRQINRAHQAMAGTAHLPRESLGDLELAAQEARWLAGDATTSEVARDLLRELGALDDLPGGPDALAVPRIDELAQRLAKALESAHTLGQRDEIVRHFNLDEIDPLYRKAVETYFERLSREGAAKKSSVGP